MINFLNFLGVLLIIYVRDFIFVSIQFYQNRLNIFWQQNKLTHQFCQSKNLNRTWLRFLLSLFIIKEYDKIKQIIELIEIPLLWLNIIVDLLINRKQISVYVWHCTHQLFHDLLFFEF